MYSLIVETRVRLASKPRIHRREIQTEASGCRLVRNHSLQDAWRLPRWHRIPTSESPLQERLATWRPSDRRGQIATRACNAVPGQTFLGREFVTRINHEILTDIANVALRDIHECNLAIPQPLIRRIGHGQHHADSVPLTLLRRKHQCVAIGVPQFDIAIQPFEINFQQVLIPHFIQFAPGSL